MGLKFEKLVSLGCIVFPRACASWVHCVPSTVGVPRSLRVVKLREDLGAPNLVVGVCPKNGVRAPNSALKDSDSGR